MKPDITEYTTQTNAENTHRRDVKLTKGVEKSIDYLINHQVAPPEYMYMLIHCGIVTLYGDIDLGWCAVWLKSNLSPKLNMNKEELSQT